MHVSSYWPFSPWSPLEERRGSRESVGGFGAQRQSLILTMSRILSLGDPSGVIIRIGPDLDGQIPTAISWFW